MNAAQMPCLAMWLKVKNNFVYQPRDPEQLQNVIASSGLLGRSPGRASVHTQRLSPRRSGSGFESDLRPFAACLPPLFPPFPVYKRLKCQKNYLEEEN